MKLDLQCSTTVTWGNWYLILKRKIDTDIYIPKHLTDSNIPISLIRAVLGKLGPHTSELSISLFTLCFALLKKHVLIIVQEMLKLWCPLNLSALCNHSACPFLSAGCDCYHCYVNDLSRDGIQIWFKEVF